MTTLSLVCSPSVRTGILPPLRSTPPAFCSTSCECGRHCHDHPESMRGSRRGCRPRDEGIRFTSSRQLDEVCANSGRATSRPPRRLQAPDVGPIFSRLYGGGGRCPTQQLKSCHQHDVLPDLISHRAPPWSALAPDTCCPRPKAPSAMARCRAGSRAAPHALNSSALRRGLEPKPAALQWLRALRDACSTAGMSSFLRQWGWVRPTSGGRELEGREWSEFPAVSQAAPGNP